jgi:hypothetical protein
MAAERAGDRAVAALLVGARLINKSEDAVRAKRIGATAAILLLCAASGAGAQNRTPGSVDPPAATAPSSTEVTPVEEAKPAKKKSRHYRRHRGYARPFFLVPPPRYWFKPLPRAHRYRGHRYHRGCRPWYLFGRHC